MAKLTSVMLLGLDVLPLPALVRNHPAWAADE
jgi:hypothetical protein